MKHPTGGLQPATLPALPGGMFQAWNRQHQPEATTIDGGGKIRPDMAKISFFIRFKKCKWTHTSRVLLPATDISGGGPARFTI